jgi:putative ABC transport system ATP-binding protein
LTKHYGSGEALVRALDGVDIEIASGEFVAVVGTSGSGKSTLLHMLGGLDRPTSGQVFVAGKELGRMKDDELTVFRRRSVGFVFQAYNLVPNLNVMENVLLPVGLDGRKADEPHLYRVLEALGLEDLGERLPGNLSGGQQQRVAIARALANQPEIVLADEPTGNLDTKTGSEVVAMLRLMNREFGQTTVMITHNDDIAKGADRVIRIEDGRIAEGQR